MSGHLDIVMEQSEQVRDREAALAKAQQRRDVRITEGLVQETTGKILNAIAQNAEPAYLGSPHQYEPYGSNEIKSCVRCRYRQNHPIHQEGQQS